MIEFETTYRETLVRRGDEWIQKDFRDLKRGETFRLRDADTGTIVSDEGGIDTWKASTNATLGENGVYYVEIM